MELMLQVEINNINVKKKKTSDLNFSCYHSYWYRQYRVSRESVWGWIVIILQRYVNSCNPDRYGNNSIIKECPNEIVISNTTFIVSNFCGSNYPPEDFIIFGEIVQESS